MKRHATFSQKLSQWTFFFFVDNLPNDLRAYVDIKTDDLNFTHPVVLENK